jgi:hypothetical protein
MKNISFVERVRLRLRLEAYNAFNHTQFDGVDATARFDSKGVQTNSLLGQATSARAPRVVQLGVTLNF